MSAVAADGLHLDGIPDETLWQDAQAFDQFRVTVPYTLDAPHHPTKALLRALPEGLAVAFIVEQPPGTPRVKPRAGRDSDTQADRVNFAVDFDGDGRLAYNFMVTLGNAIADEVISNENSYNADWDAPWQYGLHEAEDRWSVEMLIPWSIAAMRESDTPTRTIGVHFDRVLASRNERSATTASSYERPRFVSEFTRIEVERHRNAGLLSIVPHVSSQYDFVGNGSDVHAGGDLFWKPSGQFQLSATVKPDFGQVEADDLVVDFSAIEVFFSDKRPFFTENQGIFDLRTPDSGQLVYTRRMGGPSDGNGRAAEIDAAVKLNGSLADFEYGTLAVLESDSDIDPGRSFVVQRLLHDVGPVRLGWLGTWTDRPLFDRRAQVQAVDAVWRPNARWMLSGQVLGSNIREGEDRQKGEGAWLRAFYTPSERFQHELEVTHFDRRLDFNDIGYQRRGDYNELEWTSTLRQSGFGDDDWRRSVTWAIEPQMRYNDQGDRLPPTLIVTRNLDTRAGGLWGSELIYSWRGYDDLISRGNGLVVQEPRLQSLWQSYESPRLGQWSWELGVWAFQEGNDGYAVQPEAGVAYYPRENLDLRLQFLPRWSQDWLLWREDTLFASYRRQQRRLDFDVNWDPGQRHELRLKALWRGGDAYDPSAYRIGAGGHLVASNDAVEPFTVNSIGLQLRYRYEFSQQRELYVVYARGGHAEELQSIGNEHEQRRGLGDLFGDIADLRDADQILVKLRWAL